MNKRLNLQTTSSTKEVVHIDDSGNSGNKTPVRNKAESRRPTINKPIKPTIQRTVISTPKFSNLQRKLSQTPKAVPGTSNVHIQDTTPTTTMYNPLTPVANSQQPAVSQNNIVKRKTPSRVSLPVPCITKSNERVVPIITEAPAKVILNPGLTNKSEAANGHLYLSSPQVSHLLPAQISITPLAQAKFIQISSSKIQTPKVTPPSQRKYLCSRCKQPSQTPELCDNCQSLSAVSSTSQVPKVSAPSKTEKPVVPKRPIMTKEKFYGNKSSSPSVTPVRGNNYQEHANPRKVFIAADTQGKPRGRPKGSKNRIIEPECLTIESSDEEQEAATRTCQVSSVINTRKQLRNSYNPYQRGVPARLRGTGSRRYCTVKTSTDSSITIENEDNEIIEDEEEGLDDEEDVEDEEDGIDSEHPGNHRIPYNEDCDGKLKSFTLLCRSIRIGSFKIHPLNDLPHLSVLVSPDGFSFRVSKTTQASELVSISLKAGDIAQVLGHFGRCLPIIFIFTTPSCAARIRLRLGMVKGSHLYYDPELADEKQKRITFLIDNINDNMKGFLRNTFPGDGILKEIDQKQANEILVKSTPNQQVGIRNSSSTYQSPPPAPPPQPQQPPPPPTVTVPATLLQVQPIVQLSGQPLQSIVQSLQPHVAVTVTLPIQMQRNIPQKDGSSPPKETMKIERPSSPVRKIVTYPPPPEPDNIELNNVDLACLEEGEFLNDKIIDFYLRYLALEMIPEEDRERTHVFNSYFYRGLTQKLQKRASEDRHKTIAEMRHRQVKKWTKNLDIFEKDFIIIPINQNVHWFLAIICYPKLASEGKKSPKNSSTSHVKKPEESNSLSNNKPPEVSSGSSISVLINTISPVKTREQTSSTNDRRENNTPDYFEASEDEDDSPSGRLPPDVPNVANAARPAPGSKMPFIILFDSLQTASRQVIGKTLKEYLEWEWKSKKGTTGVFDTASVLHGTVCVPQQTNYSDCGIYVLQYVQSFFEDPFPYIAYPLPDMRNWFDSNKVSNKRKEIKDLIYDLEKRQSPPMASTSSNNKPSSGRMDNEPSPNSSQSS